MKKFTLLFFACAAQFCSAQNLVPNPSFEDTVSCPDFAGQVWKAQGWYISENTPDYYNACCTDQLASVSVPNNALGFRYAATGVAYCGIFTYGHIPALYREYIGIQLLQPLEIGTRYFVSFKLSSVSCHSEGTNSGSDKTGLLFSTVKYDLTHLPPTSNFSQIFADSIITDTTGWDEIKKSFIADSSYKYITMGNFFTDSFTNVTLYWSLSGNDAFAYYFIDDICVTKDSAGCYFGDAIPNITTTYPFRAYPNPANEFMHVQVNSELSSYMTLHNSLGQVVYSSAEMQGNKNNQIDVSKFPQGIYLLQLTTNKKIFSQKISIVH